MSAIDNKNVVVQVEGGVITDVYICTDKYYKDNYSELYSNHKVDVAVYGLTLLMQDVKGDDN